MSTTPAAELAYSARGFRLTALVDPPEAATGSTTLVEFVEPSSAPVTASRPVTAPAPSNAAPTATATRAARAAPPADRRRPGASGGGGGLASRPVPGPFGWCSVVGGGIKN